MFWLYATLTWLGFAVLAVALGTLRVLFLEPLTGEPVAHVSGTLFGCVLFLVIIYRFVAWTNLSAPGARRKSRLVALGLFWTILTIAFEFGFGHYVRGLSWQLLLADYNLFAGRIWVLVLATLYAGPRLAAWAMTRRRK